MLADAHIHLADLVERDAGFPETLAAWARSENICDSRRESPAWARSAQAWTCCAACHSRADWERTESLRHRLPPFILSLGMHPQAPDLCDARFLEELAGSGRLAAVGEAGFDFFGDRPERVRNDENLKRQRAAFEFQLDLARRFDLPILLHLRKAMDLVFEYSSTLKRLPSVIFHSYPGTAGEAASLLNRGIPAWFSFGASLINGNKRAGSACASIPLERLLIETDAPWQPPRRINTSGPDFCRPEDIREVLSAAAKIRAEDTEMLEEALASNFFTAFRVNAKFFEAR